MNADPGVPPVTNADPGVPPEPADEAETLWAQAKQRIMEMNPTVYFYVKDTRGAAIRDGVLTVEFPAAQESMLNGMRAARNLQIAKNAIEAVRPQTELSFRLAALANENEEKLKELFGSSLTIK
jgi:hypothetical protein